MDKEKRRLSRKRKKKQITKGNNCKAVKEASAFNNMARRMYDFCNKDIQKKHGADAPLLPFKDFCERFKKDILINVYDSRVEKVFNELQQIEAIFKQTSPEIKETLEEVSLSERVHNRAMENLCKS